MLRKNDTSPRHIHAVLAAAVDDPNLLEELHREAKSSTTKAKAVALDFDRVRLFAGLAVKVRQNDLRLSLPLTFRLLDLFKISIEFFASYAKEAASLRKANKKSRSDKIQSFFEFLDRWLNREDPDHALVWDIIRYERALIDLREAAAVVRGELDDAARKRVTAKSVPIRRKQTIHHDMSCNPLELGRVLRSRTGDSSGIQRGEFHYVYRWDNLRACVSIDEIDELGYVLFDCANGRHSVARIAALLRQAGVAVDAKSLCDAVQELVDNGMLTLRE